MNQSELETFARQFRLAGHSLTPNIELADLVVINTCAVTAAAASDSRQKIRQAARAGSPRVVVTGCFATLDPQDTYRLPGVDLVIGNHEKENLVSTALNIPIIQSSRTMLGREPIPGTRLRTRAFIKVQDGCDNYCTYCITRIARGSSRSCEIEAILADVQSALEGGTQEIVLTGVHLGSWGYEFIPPTRLFVLVKTILDETKAPRLRLSSLEPWDISSDFFDLWQNPRLCRQLHLPLQSGCKETLKRMGRRITPEWYAKLIDQARLAIPGVAISTDIITGFPGETEAEFLESEAFVKEMSFAAGHVFTYSARPGTVAATLPDQIPHHISKQRSLRMHVLLQQSSTAYKANFLGAEIQVLWEKVTPIDETLWKLSGLSDNYLRVHAYSSTPYQNCLMQVRVTGIQDGELLSEIMPV